MGLGICKGCGRFARGESCPFCGASVDPPRAGLTGRRTRTGKLVVASALAAAATLASCSAYGVPPRDDSGVTDAGTKE